MRGTDEQLQEIMRRAEGLKERRRRNKAILTDAVSSGVLFALLIAAIAYVPKLPALQTAGTETRYGSLLLAAPSVGYVIVGLLAFALGVCVTLLCCHLKKREEPERP